MERPDWPAEPTAEDRRRIFETTGLIQVVVNRRIDTERVIHRDWFVPAEVKHHLLMHHMLPGDIIGVIVDGRPVPV
jgi:hypothetical protein